MLEYLQTVELGRIRNTATLVFFWKEKLTTVRLLLPFFKCSPSNFPINNVRIKFYAGIYSTVHLIAASGVGVSGRVNLLSLFYSVELS